MRELLERVGRLQRLAVFDAASRLGSFTAAARDLGISQPAVTRQIRSLEWSLGVALFERSANRIALTEDGRRLATSLDAGFVVVEQALADVCGDGGTFVLASPPGFAHQLIVPALDQLHDAVHAAMPDADIRLWLYHRDSELATGHHDAVIRLGDGRWSGLDARPLFRERAVPVATRAFADEHGLDTDSSAEAVLAAPLIHMDADDRPWISWSDWLAHFGLSLSSRRRVVHNTYPTVIQQALAGRGVALGWRGIVDGLLDDGLIVPVGPEVAGDRFYHVAWRADRRTPAVDSVVEWMLANLTA